MKKLIAAALLLFTASVSADDNEVAVMKNSAGGSIVLTQRECPVTRLTDFRLAYTWSPESQIYGCWKIQKNNRMVDVFWVTPDGERHHRVYDSEEFKLLKAI